MHFTTFGHDERDDRVAILRPSYKAAGTARTIRPLCDLEFCETGTSSGRDDSPRGFHARSLPSVHFCFSVCNPPFLSKAWLAG